MEQKQIQELITRSQRQDTTAFAQLVAEFQPFVFRVAFRLLCNEDEAKDMVQETFIKIWLALDKYNQESRFSTWLYKIACNTCYDRLRSLQPHDNESVYTETMQMASDDDPETCIANKQLKEIILQYTHDLAPQQKLIFILRDVEEVDTAEVEAITGLSAGQIKSTLYIARQKIRNRITQIGGKI